MHGPAVASLLVGNRCGTAPDAKVHFVAAPSWTGDTAFQAKALDWIVEKNATLPADQKIRAVSISAVSSGEDSPFTKTNLPPPGRRWVWMQSAKARLDPGHELDSPSTRKSWSGLSMS